MSHHSKSDIIDIISHYQSSLERYTESQNEQKILHCLNKLSKLPIMVSHLEQTGIGRTVNSLRKCGNEVGEASKTLVAKWKEMVVQEEKSTENNEEKVVKDKQNEKSSSSRDKSGKHENGEINHKTVKRKHEESDDDKHSKRHKKHDSSEEEKNSKHKHSHSNSESKSKSSSHKHSQRKHEEKEYNNHQSEKKSDKSSKDKSSHKEHKSSSSKEKKSDHKSEKSTESKSSSKKEKSTKSKPNVCENGIGSESGASFAEALGMLEPCSSKTVIKYKKVSPSSSMEKINSKVDKPPMKPKTKPPSPIPPLLAAKKLEPLDLNISNLLPTITPNYRPLGLPVDNANQKHKQMCEEETLSFVISSKNQRTKVYSGNKTYHGEVPKLFDLCIRVLQDNIDSLEYTGGVPYYVLKPILEKATADQLFVLEHHNPYIIDDSDELWRLHCLKEFKTKQREEMETWRDMYMRCIDEREAKLKALTANIKQAQDKSIPVRQTKLAYVDSVVKPPRSVARKQAKNGIDTGKPLVTPTARLASLATAGEAGKIAVPNPGNRAASSSSHTTVMKPKKAPLMQKTLALIKSRFRR